MQYFAPLNFTSMRMNDDDKTFVKETTILLAVIQILVNAEGRAKIKDQKFSANVTLLRFVFHPNVLHSISKQLIHLNLTILDVTKLYICVCGIHVKILYGGIE